MKRAGFAELPLHGGRAPAWLVKRMIKLANCIVTVIIDEYGRDLFLRRLADPYWFQALGCVLGYDWHSSGLTTVLTGVLKSAIDPSEFGLAVCGGKGRVSRMAPSEIHSAGEKLGLSTSKIDEMVYASRMSAKVDNSALQDGYQLYHHAFFMTEDGKWTVIQQGMNTEDRTARRYHWLSENIKSFVVEPHSAIISERRMPCVLDMTARESEGCRRATVDIVKEDPRRLSRNLRLLQRSSQRILDEWMPIDEPAGKFMVKFLSMPLRINWDAVKRAYEFQPRNYEELLGIRGVGPATVRGLALISDLIYGEEPSWRDPVKYSFAYGGKDGVPFPVDRRAMDESIRILKHAIEMAKLNDKERLRSLRRLRELLPGSRKP
ncbi:DUF763 domain-containing protein [Candidatus Bathyarchaeota archaeon]|nr:DUF763 domain-containing protein [Candidatus Bathyarchaeota archaeon]